MKATAAESADLKQALKHEFVTEGLRREAERFPDEAREALEEVELGHDESSAGSWVAEQRSR